MAIDLLHSSLQKGQTAAAQSKSNTVTSGGQALQSQQVMRAIRMLQAGQTIQGEILSVKGDEVQLSVMNQMVLEARLEQSISLTPGMLMAFQVKSNNSSGLSLMPLFTNTALDPNAVKALDMAGIPLNERTLEMVQTLMERGLPIDKQSLQEVYREVIAYKDSSPRDIISLRQMNLPVTGENLTQFSLYENNQHYLSNTFSEVGQTIGNQLLLWVQEGKPEKAEAFLGQLKQIFTEAGFNREAKVLYDSQLKNEQQMSSQPENEQPISDQPQTIVHQGQKEKPLQQPIQLAQPSLEEGKQIIIREEDFYPLKEEMSKGAEGKEDLAALQKDQGAQAVKSMVSLQDNGWNQLAALLSQEKSSSKITAMFQKLWNQEIKPQLLMEPKQVMEKEQIQEFYEKLTRQMQQLETLAKEHGQASSPLGKAVQNTISNLDFMNQMNQFHSYIQLPLKLARQEAKGELYVFTNKRSMAREDGRVTALLHLDMEYLGKMDVFVALEKQKVSTQFYLEKEEYMDFLEKNMDRLSARLNKRGYECNLKACLRKEEEGRTVMEQIIGKQSQSVLLSTQAFDMRA